MEYNEFIRKYGKTEVVFSSYYKYTFHFKSLDGKVEISIGGFAEDIYGLNVTCKPVKIESLSPHSATVDDKYYDWRW